MDFFDIQVHHMAYFQVAWEVTADGLAVKGEIKSGNPGIFVAAMLFPVSGDQLHGVVGHEVIGVDAYVELRLDNLIGFVVSCV